MQQRSHPRQSAPTSRNIAVKSSQLRFSLSNQPARLVYRQLQQGSLSSTERL